MKPLFSSPDNYNRQKENDLLPDSRKIVHRHLKDKDDVITDDDIRNVRISTYIPPRNLSIKDSASSGK